MNLLCVCNKVPPPPGVRAHGHALQAAEGVQRHPAVACAALRAPRGRGGEPQQAVQGRQGPGTPFSLSDTFANEIIYFLCVTLLLIK